MNIRTLDLNLLRVFAAIYVERNVSAAARRENLSQPAMSNALMRLRRSFNDELFVKTPMGMEPTARARQLIQPISDALNILKQGLVQTQVFDPRTMPRHFKLLMSDAGESSILPALMRHISSMSTKVSFEVLNLPHERYAEALQTGAADVAIGYLPFLKSGFERAHLFDDHYSVILRNGHPLLKRRLSMNAFIGAEHVAVSTGKADALVDKQLSKNRQKRHIKLKVSHYHVAVDIVAGSDLIATVPQMIAASAMGVSVQPLPFKVEPASVLMVWHSILQQDPTNQWLRRTVTQLGMSGSGH
jgi:DNA-binding transcriptional LysR family regulator